MNDDSILNTIKKMLGVEEAYFDNDLIIHINSVFMILNQMGVGPEEGFFITGESEVWSDFTDNKYKLESAKSYIYLKVRLLFDPPTTSTSMDANTRLISELEWRLNMANDPWDSIRGV